MGTLEIMPATRLDAEKIALNLREADLREVEASTLETPLAALLECLKYTVAPLVVRKGGEPICMFGVASQTLMAKTGHPWLVATPELDRHGLWVGKMSRRYLDAMQMAYNHLTNFVDARNTTAVRWLEWLGFTVYDPEPHGPLQLPFHKFEMRT